MQACMDESLLARKERTSDAAKRRETGRFMRRGMDVDADAAEAGHGPVD